MKKAKVLKLNGKSKEIALDPSKLAEAHAVWDMVTQGKSPYTIALSLGIATHKVRKIITTCMEEFSADIQADVANQRAMDIARHDALIEHFMPVAQQIKASVTRFNSKGEPFTDEEFKYPIAAAEVVMKAMQARAKLFGYEAKPDNQPVINNHAFFLSKPTESDFVKNLIDAQPVEIERHVTDLPLYEEGP